MCKASRDCAKREQEPWLLAASLRSRKDIAKKIRRLYATRMQIEEALGMLKQG